MRPRNDRMTQPSERKGLRDRASSLVSWRRRRAEERRVFRRLCRRHNWRNALRFSALLECEVAMSEIYLRHGIFLPPFHPNEEDPTQCLERDLELMAWLDKLGFHEAWIGEHHSAGYE